MGALRLATVDPDGVGIVDGYHEDVAGRGEATIEAGATDGLAGSGEAGLDD